MNKTHHVIFLLIIMLVSTFACAQNYLLDNETNAFHARTGLIRIGIINENALEFSTGYTFKGRFTAEFDFMHADLSNHICTVVGPSPIITMSLFDLELDYLLLKQKSYKVPFNLSLNTKLGGQLDHFQSLLVPATEPVNEWSNRVRFGTKISSSHQFYKVSNDLHGGISLLLAAEFTDNVPDIFDVFYFIYGNSFVSEIRVDLIYKKVGIYGSATSYLPFGSEFSQGSFRSSITRFGLEYYFKRS